MIIINSKREFNFDLLRIFATLCVVILHVSAQGWSSADLNSSNWYAMNTYDSLVRWTVPVFVMISGTMFLNPAKELPTKKLYGKSVLRLLTAFIFWSAIYAIVSSLTNGFQFESFVKNVIQGNGHMWFLPMLAGLYILTPIFRIIVQNEKLTKYFLILSLIFNIGTHTVFSVLAPLLQNNAFSSLVYTLEKTINLIDLNPVKGYGFYYVLGYYLHSASINKKSRILIYVAALINFIAIIVGTHYATAIIGAKYQNFYSNYSLFVAITAAGMFLLFKNLKINLNSTAQKITLSLSKWSFGVYLIHEMMISVFNRLLNFNVYSLNAWISIPLLSLSIFTVSTIISAIINKIPLLKKYIV